LAGLFNSDLKDKITLDVLLNEIFEFNWCLFKKTYGELLQHQVQGVHLLNSSHAMCVELNWDLFKKTQAGHHLTVLCTSYYNATICFTHHVCRLFNNQTVL